MRILQLTVLFFSLTTLAFGQANGKLQIHFMDVGQGDGAILISPLGETVLFDNGKRGNCDLPVSYLQQGIQGRDEDRWSTGPIRSAQGQQS
jgi:beta-lactamase superfamily II metal-dependent hydrolase